MNGLELSEHYHRQRFPNDYALVDGVAMHRENGERFQIPHDVLKKHVAIDYFVELRIDSPRFSVHEDAPEKCTCSSCNGEATKPILRHEHPASLLPLEQQAVPSRGWGEDFWVQVVDRDQHWFSSTVDNPLVECRLHELRSGDRIYFHRDHILAVHGIHRQEMLVGMDAADLKSLAQWLRSQG